MPSRLPETRWPSVPGLADLARVTVEECVNAIERLASPDEYSRTKDNEGRRIREQDGGWVILNHGKYKAKMSADDRREYMREYMEERRKLSVNICKQKLTQLTHSDSYSDTDSNKNKSNTSLVSLADIDAFWKAYPRKVAKQAALKAWNRASKKPIIEVILSALEIQKKSEQWTKDDGQFIPHPATWINAGRWDDEVIEKKPLKLFTLKVDT